MRGFWFLRFPCLQLVISLWIAANSPAHSVLPSVWHHPLRWLPSHRLKPWWSCWTLSTPGWSWGMVITTDLQSGHSLTSSLSTHFQAQQISQIFSHLYSTSPKLGYNYVTLACGHWCCSVVEEAVTKNSRSEAEGLVCFPVSTAWPLVRHPSQRADATCCLNKSTYPKD